MLLTEDETKYKVQYDLHVVGIVEMYAEGKREQVIIAVNISESFTHHGTTVLIILFGLSQLIFTTTLEGMYYYFPILHTRKLRLGKLTKLH